MEVRVTANQGLFFLIRGIPYVALSKSRHVLSLTYNSYNNTLFAQVWSMNTF